MCVAEPKVNNATTDWDETAVWYIGDNVTATCLDKYHLHGDVVSQTLACTATGWEEVEGCVLIPCKLVAWEVGGRFVCFLLMVVMVMMTIMMIVMVMTINSVKDKTIKTIRVYH